MSSMCPCASVKISYCPSHPPTICLTFNKCLRDHYPNRVTLRNIIPLPSLYPHKEETNRPNPVKPFAFLIPGRKPKCPRTTIFTRTNMHIWFWISPNGTQTPTSSRFPKHSGVVSKPFLSWNRKSITPWDIFSKALSNDVLPCFPPSTPTSCTTHHGVQRGPLPECFSSHALKRKLYL